MTYVFAGGIAVLVVIVQARLLRAVARATSGAVRGALLSIKLPIWAGFFIALALWGKGELLVGGLVAGAGYLAFAIRIAVGIAGGRSSQPMLPEAKRPKQPK